MCVRVRACVCVCGHLFENGHYWSSEVSPVAAVIGGYSSYPPAASRR